MDGETKAALDRIGKALGCGRDEALAHAVQTLDRALDGDEALVMTKRDLALAQIRFAEHSLSNYMGRPYRAVARDGELTFEPSDAPPQDPPFIPMLVAGSA